MLQAPLRLELIEPMEEQVRGEVIQFEQEQEVVIEINIDHEE